MLYTWIRVIYLKLESECLVLFCLDKFALISYVILLDWP